MSSALSILSSLSDLKDNPKFEHYDPHVCRDIHIKLDQDAREKGLSYEERFDAVKPQISLKKRIELFAFYSFRQRKTCPFMRNGLRFFPMVSRNA